MRLSFEYQLHKNEKNRETAWLLPCNHILLSGKSANGQCQISRIELQFLGSGGFSVSYSFLRCPTLQCNGDRSQTHTHTFSNVKSCRAIQISSLTVSIGIELSNTRLPRITIFRELLFCCKIIIITIGT